MEALGVCPAQAQSMISEGKDQLVPIDYRTMLRIVMKELGSSQPPILTICDHGSEGMNVTVKLDVSCTKYSVGKKIHKAEVESGLCKTRAEAKKAAVSKAFKHLNEQHLVKIKDYSSRMLCELDDMSVFGHVNSAMYNFEKIVGQWETVMEKFDSIAVQLVGKEAGAGVEMSETGQEEMYADLNQFMKMTKDMFKGHLSEAREKETEPESDRKKYHSRSTEKYHANLRKGYLQNVLIEAKDVLSYVLTYIGAGQPTYTNRPNDSGLMEGVVTFNIPDIPDVDLCGNITITGSAMRSREAEQTAAFKALMYLEDKFKLRVVDLNYAERVSAEKDEKFLVNVLDKIVAAADEAKRYWKKMVKTMATEKAAYPLKGVDMTEAYKFCANCLDDLVQDATNRFGDCAGRFQAIEQVQCKADDMKAALKMEY